MSARRRATVAIVGGAVAVRADEGLSLSRAVGHEKLDTQGIGGIARVGIDGVGDLDHVGAAVVGGTDDVGVVLEVVGAAVGVAGVVGRDAVVGRRAIILAHKTLIIKTYRAF